MKIDPALLDLIADNLNNLSSGWFGIVIGILILSPGSTPDFLALTATLIAGIVSLLAAYFLKKYVSKHSKNPRHRRS